MAFVVSKTFDWQEDLENYKFDFITISKGLASSYRVHRKLSWKRLVKKAIQNTKTNQKKSVHH